MKYDIFLSHSSKDKAFVRKLAKDLENLGLKIWLDEWEIKVGECIPTKISEGIENSKFVVLVISQNSIKSSWVDKEWKLKYWDEINEKSIKILPVVVEECEIPVLLKTKKYANFKIDYIDGFEQLSVSLFNYLKESKGISEDNLKSAIEFIKTDEKSDETLNYEILLKSNSPTELTKIDDNKNFKHSVYISNLENRPIEINIYSVWSPLNHNIFNDRIDEINYKLQKNEDLLYHNKNTFLIPPNSFDNKCILSINDYKLPNLIDYPISIDNLSGIYSDLSLKKKFGDFNSQNKEFVLLSVNEINNLSDISEFKKTFNYKTDEYKLSFSLYWRHIVEIKSFNNDTLNVLMIGGFIRHCPILIYDKTDKKKAFLSTGILQESLNVYKNVLKSNKRLEILKGRSVKLDFDSLKDIKDSILGSELIEAEYANTKENEPNNGKLFALYTASNEFYKKQIDIFSNNPNLKANIYHTQ